MKTITREDWIKALESGEYAQATGTLAEYDRGMGGIIKPIAFCCMGVACAIAEVPLDPKTGWRRTNDINISTGHGDGRGGLMPLAVAEMLELDADTMWELSSWNDRRRMTFSEIAKEIPSLPKSDWAKP